MSGLALASLGFEVEMDKGLAMVLKGLLQKPKFRSHNDLVSVSASGYIKPLLQRAVADKVDQMPTPQGGFGAQNVPCSGAKESNGEGDIHDTCACDSRDFLIFGQCLIHLL